MDKFTAEDVSKNEISTRIIFALIVCIIYMMLAYYFEAGWRGMVAAITCSSIVGFSMHFEPPGFNSFKNSRYTVFNIVTVFISVFTALHFQPVWLPVSGSWAPFIFVIMISMAIQGVIILAIVGATKLWLWVNENK